MSLMSDIKYQIVTPVVTALRLPGDNTARIQITTGIGNVESGYRTKVQGNNGPARGFFQMEPNTHDDLWRSYLPAHPDLSAIIKGFMPSRFVGQPIGNGAQALLESDAYAAAMTTILIRRSPYALAVKGDASGQCSMWKSAYNSSLGAGVVNAASIALFQAAIDA